MLLPFSSFTVKWPRRQKRGAAPRRTNELRDVDAILDKISREGFDSLTQEEKALLDRVSTKYQTRAKSEKPKSDLII